MLTEPLSTSRRPTSICSKLDGDTRSKTGAKESLSHIFPPYTHTVAMSRPQYRDPWAAREAWRKHPVFTNRFYVRNVFPGLGLGAAAFGVYLAVDYLTHPTNLDTIREDAHRQLANQGTIFKGH